MAWTSCHKIAGLRSKNASDGAHIRPFSLTRIPPRATFVSHHTMKPEPGKTSLAPLTTFGLGGPCDDLREASTAREIADALRDWSARQMPWHVLGGGSNLLIADEGVPGGVLRLTPPPDASAQVLSDGTLLCPAGMRLDEAVLQGIETGQLGALWPELSGIPGTVGGAVCGNAGAFGVQIGDFVDKVELVRPDGCVDILEHDALAFAYRTSALQRGIGILSRIWLRGPGALADRSAARARRDEILALRHEKHPTLGPGLPGTAGSFFRNLPPPEPGARRQPAGALLDAVGAKTMRVGGAYVFEKHANILMAGPGATAADVRVLAERLQSAVRDRFGVSLTWEVRAWPAID